MTAGLRQRRKPSAVVSVDHDCMDLCVVVRSEGGQRSCLLSIGHGITSAARTPNPSANLAGLAPGRCKGQNGEAALARNGNALADISDCDGALRAVVVCGLSL
jgi:hypothetical protein